ncbi:MAG: hypothetical protein ACLQPN_01740 [Bryobacteraceae bacterium]
MDEKLDANDLAVIIESLNHYKSNVENYAGYPSYEFKRSQIERVESAIRKVRALKIGDPKIAP